MENNIVKAADPSDLARFVKAQDPVFKAVVAELAAGRKTSHWMWFVFPQIQGLGGSEMARRYALGSVGEARAYLAHPLLGPRLRRCVELMMACPGSDAEAVLGAVDGMKLRSCLTLFDLAEPGGLFESALSKFYEGVPDMRTVQLAGAA